MAQEGSTKRGGTGERRESTPGGDDINLRIKLIATCALRLAPRILRLDPRILPRATCAVRSVAAAPAPNFVLARDDVLEEWKASPPDGPHGHVTRRGAGLERVARRRRGCHPLALLNCGGGGATRTVGASTRALGRGRDPGAGEGLAGTGAGVLDSAGQEYSNLAGRGGHARHIRRQRGHGGAVSKRACGRRRQRSRLGSSIETPAVLNFHPFLQIFSGQRRQIRPPRNKKYDQ